MEEFFEQLQQAGAPIFVVVDGALVEDIRATLSENQLKGRPIFQSTDWALIRSGPWLVSSGTRNQNLSRAVRTARACRSGVCWVADCGAEAVVRHLRTLNVARLPDQRIVWFRHYDPDVLAFLTPMLDAEQASKIFGPAQMLGFVTGRGAGATVEKPDDLPQSIGGTFSLNEAQYSALGERQTLIWRQRRASLLRETYPVRWHAVPDTVLADYVVHQEERARSAGLRSQRAFFQWTCLDMVSNGKVQNDMALRRHIVENGRQRADETLDGSIGELLTLYDTRPRRQ